MCEHTFVSTNPNHKGNVAEAQIAAAAIKLGVKVFFPMVEHARYDLVFDIADRLYRVQCKWAGKRNGVIEVGLTGSRYTSRGQVQTVYSQDEVDLIGVYCEQLDNCYLIPIEQVAGRRAVWLRVDPARNHQRACLNWAADYELPGAIAQLGERRAGSAKVVGSSPTSSTFGPPAIGAHGYREKLGWYLERAAAGESFVITRHGKPLARLSPPQDPLDVAAAPPQSAPKLAA
jgi:prevent-host-death family protein